MRLRIRIPRPSEKHSWASLLLRVALFSVASVVLVVLLVGGWYNFKYHGIVDERLRQPIFANTAKIFAAPREVRPGQKLSIALIANELREAGYSTDGAAQASPLGTYSQGVQAITVRPGPESYHSQDSATIRVASGVVQSIVDDHGQPLASYELEPLLITGLSDDANRTKRRLVTYDELPQNLVQAVLAIEDRRFFEHSGVNYWRLVDAVFHDVTTGQKQQGGSTLTMQLARGFFLSPEKRIKRKIIEIVITFQLEHRFTKKQIFQMYANEINLGQRGSFSIDGFGEASQAYFGKDVRQLNLAECALLAGMIQRPNYFNPFRHPDRTIERRNLVLDSMVETGAITKDQAERAKAEPLHLSAASVDASEAPYFVDLVHDQLLQKLGERDFNREGLRIYTSLDPDLQRVATAAVDSTIHIVDEQVDKLHARTEKARPDLYLSPGGAGGAQSSHRPGAGAGGRAQLRQQPVGPRHRQASHRLHLQALRLRCGFSNRRRGHHAAGPDQALLAPHHAQRRADHIWRGNAVRVHAAQLRRRVSRPGDGPLRPAAVHQQRHHRPGRMVGFDRVAALAREAGIKNARGTPSMAIGSYDATPLDMAGAYTIFANSGLHLDPWMLASVRTPTGDIITDYTPASRQILDPRVAYLTTSMMENVYSRPRNRRWRPQHGIHRAGRRQNRHQPRRMVCRLHQQPALHRVGRQRRLYRYQDRGRACRRAHLGRVHEEGRAAAAVL